MKIVILVISFLLFIGNIYCKDTIYVSINKPIEISSKEKEETWMIYLKDSITILSLGFAIFFGFKGITLFRKKLGEDYIKQIILNSQESKKNIGIECHKLLDKYYIKLPNGLGHYLTNEEILEVLEDIKNLNYLAIGTTKEIETYTYLLKDTIINVYNTYSVDNTYMFTSLYDLYLLCINIFYEIIFFTSKVIDIPYSSKTEPHIYLKKRIGKFAANNNLKQFKYLDQGIDRKANSIITAMFISQVNLRSNFVMSKSAYGIYSSPAPIALLLLNDSIYFPLIFESNPNPEFPNIKYVLSLIAFDIRWKKDEQSEKKIVKFIYVNLGINNMSFQNLDKDNFQNTFQDAYIDSKNIEIDKVNKIGRAHV